MKKFKYLSILVLVCLLTLTGCEFGKKGSSKAADKRLEDALINLAKADSFTATLKASGEYAEQKIDEKATFKAAKNNKSYDLYLGLTGVANGEEANMEVYLLSGKDNMDLYLSFKEGSWAHIALDNSDVSNTTDVDVDKYADGFDEKEVKDLVKNFKKVKAGKTKNGVTEIIATIAGDELLTGLGQTTDDMDITFLVDKKDNLVGIEVALDDNFTIELEISKINNTKVSVSSDIKDDTEEIKADELFTFLMTLIGGSITPDPIIEPEPDDIYDQTLSCKNKDESVTNKEYVEVYYKDGVIADLEMTIEFEDEEQADTAYELYSAAYEDYDDFMIVKYDNVVKMSGKAFIEGFEDVSIEELKEELEEDDAICEIK